MTPFKPGQGALSAILGDITISPIITLRSGLPFSVRIPNSTNKVNGQTLDSNYAIPFLSSRDNNRGAPFYTWDMNLQKAIYINREHNVRLNLIAQAVNILNHVNFNHVNDAFDVNGIPANGIVQTARGPLNLITGPFTGLKGVVAHQRQPADQSAVLLAGGRSATGAIRPADCVLTASRELKTARASMPSLFYFSIANTHCIDAVIVIFSGWTGGGGGGGAIFFLFQRSLLRWKVPRGCTVVIRHALDLRYPNQVPYFQAD